MAPVGIAINASVGLSLIPFALLAFDDRTGAESLPAEIHVRSAPHCRANADAAVIEHAFVPARKECEKVLAENPEFRDLHGSLGLIDAFRGGRSIAQPDFKWRWVWDPLRNDPRFQKILEGPEPTTIY